MLYFGVLELAEALRELLRKAQASIDTEQMYGYNTELSGKPATIEKLLRRLLPVPVSRPLPFALSLSHACNPRMQAVDTPRKDG